MAITLRVSSKLNGEITIAPINGTLKANHKVILSKEHFSSNTVQLALKKNFLAIENIDKEDLEFLKSSLIKITNLTDKPLSVEGYSNPIPPSHSITVNKRILDNVNVQNAINKSIKISEIDELIKADEPVKNKPVKDKVKKKDKAKLELEVVLKASPTKQLKNAEKKFSKENLSKKEKALDSMILDENSDEFKELFEQEKQQKELRAKEDRKVVAWDGENQKPLTKSQAQKKTFDNLNSDPLNAVVVKEFNQSLDSLVKENAEKKAKKVKIVGRSQKNDASDPDSDLDAFIENGTPVPEISFVDHEQTQQKLNKSKHEKIRNFPIKDRYKL